MTVIIKIVGAADGTQLGIEGQYLKSFDHDAFAGLGYGTFTFSRDQAKRFADAGEALEFWRKPSAVKPRRPDGEPNRPLTATTIEVIHI
jgi:hypothetical protein